MGSFYSTYDGMNEEQKKHYIINSLKTPKGKKLLRELYLAHGQQYNGVINVSNPAVVEVLKKHGIHDITKKINIDTLAYIQGVYFYVQSYYERMNSHESNFDDYSEAELLACALWNGTTTFPSTQA
jgi:hypothetical protein